MFAVNLIILTIGLNYITIGLFSSNSMANMLDPDLAGVGDRSVFKLNSFVLLIGCCAFVSFTERLPMWYRWLS